MFSELVDNVVIRSGRVDRIADIAAHANTTMRELQALALFWRDLVEDRITPSAGANSYTWDVPNIFRRMRTVKYANTGFKDYYPPLLRPGKVQRDQDLYYYMAQNYVVFSGLLNVFTGSTPMIDLAYYVRPRRFKYYAVANRPAVYSDDLEDWDPARYNPVLTGTPAQQAAQALVQQAQVSNWVLLGYRETVEEGALAKILKAVGDDRAASSFALYKSFQGNLEALEASESFDQIQEN